MVITLEDIWHQIKHLNVIKCNNFRYQKITTTLRAFTYGYLNITDNQFDIDCKWLQTLWNLGKNCIILKPDEGQGIVLIKKEEYLASTEKLFADKSKFRRFQKVPTLTGLITLKNYINTLLKPGEKHVNEDVKKQMKPTAVLNGRAHAYPKSARAILIYPSFILL